MFPAGGVRLQGDELEYGGAERTANRGRIASAITPVSFRHHFRIAEFSQRADQLGSQHGVVRFLARDGSPSKTFEDWTELCRSITGEPFLARPVGFIQVIRFVKDARRTRPEIVGGPARNCLDAV